MRPPKTHFEQIPVETVLKIATEMPQNNAAEKDHREPETGQATPGQATPTTPGRVTSGGDDWRELAQKVQEETDTKKMMGMVEELIAKLDEADLRKRRLLTRDNQDGPSASGV